MNRKITLLLGVLLLGSFAIQAQYCTSNAISTADDLISNVVLNGESINISNNSGSACATYTNFTALPAPDLLLTASYTIQVTMSSCGGNWTKGTEAYVDWNQDDDFDDPGEVIGVTGFSSAVPFTSSINFSVPATATPGTTRLRLVCEETGSAFNINACGTYTWGETEDYTIFVLPPSLTVLTQDTIPVLCYGDTDAIIGANVVGGTPPYSYLWSTGATTDTITNLGAGTYSVIVTDDSNDMDTSFTVITQPDSLNLDIFIDQELVCDYDISAIRAVGFGGMPSGSYAWDTSTTNFNWDTTSAVTEVTFFGNNQLSQVQPIGFDFEFFGDTFDEFIIASNGFITFQTLGGNTGCCDGGIVPSTFGPNNAIYAIWDYFTATASTYSYATLGDAPNRRMVVNFEGLPICCGITPERGNAQIIIHETSNCIEIQTDYWTPPGFGSQTQGIENAAGTEAFTYPGRNGVTWSSDTSYISFCPTDTNGLTYTWSNGYVGNYALDWDPGTYVLTLSDFNSCEKVDSVTLNEAPSAFVSNLMAEDLNCYKSQDGSIDPGISGGVMPVTYLWNNGETTATLTNIGIGNYSVSANDNLGCTIEVNNVLITEPDPLQIAINGLVNVNCPGDTNGSASAIAGGGVKPYIYVWEPNNISGNAAVGLSDGTYSIMVTDSNGCQSFSTVSILAENDLPVVDLGPDLFSSEGGDFILEAGNHTSYTWSDGSTLATLTASATGTYSVTVTNEAGCSSSDEVEVEIWALGTASIQDENISVYPNPANDFTTVNIQNADNASLEIVNAEGRIVMQYNALQNGENKLDLTQLSAGMYIMKVENGDASAHFSLSVVK